MKKRLLLIVSFTTMMIFSLYQKSISFDLFAVGLKAISTTGSLLSIAELIWNKFLWEIPARLHCNIYKRPFIKGSYNVEIEWYKNGKRNTPEKTTAKVIIQQDSENVSIYLNSETATSCSGKIDIRFFPDRYELYYNYYMIPKDSKQMKKNPAHDGSAKIIVENNIIIKWEYWTTRDTRGEIFIS